MTHIALSILFLLCCFSATKAQVKGVVDPSAAKIGIVNGSASYLPNPIYPKLPIDACASGPVSVQVLIGKNGRVRKAEAISGNSFFRPSAMKAARQARFRNIVDGPPVETWGILIYNFPPSPGCQQNKPSNVPICNSLATSLPNPDFDPSFVSDNQTAVYVDLLVGKTGGVISAKAASSVPEIRSAAEAAALNAKFRITTDRGIPVEITCRVVYRLPSASNPQ